MNEESKPAGGRVIYLDPALPGGDRTVTTIEIRADMPVKPTLPPKFWEHLANTGPPAGPAAVNRKERRRRKKADRQARKRSRG